MRQGALISVAALLGMAQLAAAQYGGNYGSYGNYGNYGNNGGNYGGSSGGSNNYGSSSGGSNYGSSSGGSNYGSSSGSSNNYGSSSGGSSNYGSGGGSSSDAVLDPNNIQTGSQSDGLQDAEEGQSASLTDNANFINFCSGKTLTNGLQQTGGSCNGIVMGDIPDQGNMVSSIIISPQPGEDVSENQSFDVQVQTSGLSAGSFTNPDSTYYAAPQALDSNGQIIGHTHVTIQDMGGSFTPSSALDASTFAFFKGINDAGNGQGLLAATVDGGLPAGTYRVCTMSSSSNHQPVLMPVAQRGAQDDCTKFTVGGGGSGGGYNNYTRRQPARRRSEEKGKFAYRKFVA